MALQLPKERVSEGFRDQLWEHRENPVCSSCHSFEWDYVEAAGTGRLYSFVVMHYPEVPPFDYPNPIGLIELDEGVRLIAERTNPIVLAEELNSFLLPSERIDWKKIG